MERVRAILLFEFHLKIHLMNFPNFSFQGSTGVCLLVVASVSMGGKIQSVSCKKRNNDRCVD